MTVIRNAFWDKRQRYLAKTNLLAGVGLNNSLASITFYSATIVEFAIAPFFDHLRRFVVASVAAQLK